MKKEKLEKEEKKWKEFTPGDNTGQLLKSLILKQIAKLLDRWPSG
jgi:hypothetical protein